MAEVFDERLKRSRMLKEYFLKRINVLIVKKKIDVK